MLVSNCVEMLPLVFGVTGIEWHCADTSAWQVDCVLSYHTLSRCHIITLLVLMCCIRHAVAFDVRHTTSQSVMQKRDSAIVASTAIYFDFRVIEFEPIRFDFYLNLN